MLSSHAYFPKYVEKCIKKILLQKLSLIKPNLSILCIFHVFPKKMFASPYYLSFLHVTFLTLSVQQQRTARYTFMKIHHSQLYYQQSATMSSAIRKKWHSLLLKEHSYNKTNSKVYIQSKYCLLRMKDNAIVLHILLIEIY